MPMPSRLHVMMDAGSGTVVVVADATTDTTGLGTPDAKVIAPPREHPTI